MRAPIDPVERKSLRAWLMRAASTRAARVLPLLAAASICVASFDRDTPTPTPTPDVSLGPELLERPGAALRVAREQLANREFRSAEVLLEAIASRHPVIADHADLLRARAQVESGRSDAAIAMLAGWEARDSPLDAAFFTLLGRAHAAKGDEAAARGAWSAAVAAEMDAAEIAALRTSIAASWERSGERERATEEYLEVWMRYPSSESAPVADEALERLHEPLGEPLRDGRAFLVRADALFAEYRNEEALAAYERARALGDLDASERRAAERRRADALFRLRRYPEAALAYAELPLTDEVAVEKARAHARSGEVLRAIRELAALGDQARSEHAPRANLIAGLLADGEGERERAEALFEKARNGRSQTIAAAAGWWLGWSRYRAGRFGDAIGYFDRLIAEADAAAALRARYWRARALEASGQGGAEGEYRALALEVPLSYYGLRAAARIAGVEPPEPEPIAPGSAALGEGDFARARMLLEAEMVEEARDELDRLYPRARGLLDRLNLAQLYAEAGEFHRGELLMVEAYSARLLGLPARGDLEIWWHAWPMPFADLFREAADAGIRVDPTLVYAVMREESGYRPDVVSIAGARGLLQIMPETGERLAAASALASFSPDDLFLPSINIRLGSAYLEQLLARFEGRESAAVASYNAGPEAVAKWLVAGPSDDDEWIEAIPYDQTREYVKRVLRSREVYRRIY